MPGREFSFHRKILGLTNRRAQRVLVQFLEVSWQNILHVFVLSTKAAHAQCVKLEGRCLVALPSDATGDIQLSAAFKVDQHLIGAAILYTKWTSGCCTNSGGACLMPLAVYWYKFCQNCSKFSPNEAIVERGMCASCVFSFEGDCLCLWEWRCQQHPNFCFTAFSTGVKMATADDLPEEWLY